MTASGCLRELGQRSYELTETQVTEACKAENIILRTEELRNVFSTEQRRIKALRALEKLFDDEPLRHTV
jgi:hypothetical protein